MMREHDASLHINPIKPQDERTRYSWGSLHNIPGVRSTSPLGWIVFCALTLGVNSSHAQTGPTERKVSAATRLDWEFAARGFGPGAAKLPMGYDSTKQKYQLYIPKSYRKDKPAPLVLFISASDSPAGWKNWQAICEKEGVLFASPFGAGNTPENGRRVRVILDVLDDIRRNYAIDPEQTYLTGFSGGGRLTCAIGFALPEFFGGIVPICGTNPLHTMAYLRHRAEDRLSVAFVTGEKDFNRKENEKAMHPWCEEVGIRSKLWIVPKMGHEVPQASVLSEVYAWLAADLKRRRDDAKARPLLAVKADDTPSAAEQAKRLVAAAQDELKQPARTWRGVTLLQGVTQRWPKSDAARMAQMMLKDIVNDDKRLQLVEQQGAADEVRSVSAQAKALEQLGNVAKAIEAWDFLAKNYEGLPIAKTALENIQRLRAKAK